MGEHEIGKKEGRGACQQDLSLGPHHVLLWHESRVRYIEKICGLWSGVLLSKSHALVRGELPPLLGLTQGTSLSRGSSCPTMWCLGALAFREPWSMHPSLNWAEEALPEM